MALRVVIVTWQLSAFKWDRRLVLGRVVSMLRVGGDGGACVLVVSGDELHFYSLRLKLADQVYP